MATKNMNTAANVSFQTVVNDIGRQNYVPVYLLMGKETYYIDRIADLITDTALTQEEKDFNLTTVYCTRETRVADIMNAAQRYPIMAKRQVVIVKEAQNLLNFDELQFYVSRPVETTILVICYKHGNVDRRKKTVALIAKNGLVFESPEVKPEALPAFIEGFLQKKGIGIERQAVMMMVEHVGANLSRMKGELDKLVLALPKGTMRITPDLVELHVGISKEYNLWEFRAAVANKDLVKANRILTFFNENPKVAPPQVILPTIFNFFAAVMQLHYAPEKSPRGMCAHLGLRGEWQLREYLTGMQNYSAMKTMLVIGRIREADARLKGIGRGTETDADIMTELLFFILH